MPFTEQEQLVIGFYYAAKECNLTALEECLNKGVDPLSKLPDSWLGDLDREQNVLQTLFSSSGKPESQLIDAAKIILKKIDDPKAYLQRSEGVLHTAIIRGHLKLGGFLIERGAKIDAPDSDGNTPLHKAVSEKNYKAAEMLLSPAYLGERNPNEYVNIENKKGQTTLHLAGDDKLTKLILDKGGDIEKEDKEKRTPLFYSAARSDIQSMKLITEQMRERSSDALKEYVNHFDDKRETALHETLKFADEGREKVAATNHLLVSGADPYHRGLHYSFVPAQIIAAEGDISSVKLMTEQERPHETEKERTNHLMDNFLSAVSVGNTEVMEYLVTQGAGINPKQDEEAGFSFFSLRVRDKDFPGITIDEKDFFSSAPLHIAAYKGDTETIKWLLNKGADATAKDGLDNTPVHVAASASNYAALKMLFAHIEKHNGRDAVKEAANARNSDEQTPVHQFVTNNKYRAKEDNPITDADTETMHVLDGAGSNWKTKDKEGVSPSAIWSKRVKEYELGRR